MGKHTLQANLQDLKKDIILLALLLIPQEIDCFITLNLRTVVLLIFCRWGAKMPDIVKQSIMIISNGGVGMAMFSLGISKHDQ